MLLINTIYSDFLFKNMMFSSIKKYIISAIIILIIISGGYFFLFKRNENSTENNSSLNTEKALQEVTLYDLEKNQDANIGLSTIGSIESQTQITFKSEISSSVKKIYFKLGDSVKKGDLLLELDHSMLDAQLQQSSAGIDRSKSLLNQQLAGPAESKINQSLSVVEQAQAGLKQAQEQLTNLQLTNKNKINTEKLSLEQAYNDLIGGNDLNYQSIETIYSQLLQNAKSVVTTVQSALMTITDIQYAYFSCTNDITCSRIAYAKEQSIYELFSINNGGRFNREAIADLNTGVVGFIKEKNNITAEELEDKIPKLISGIINLKKTVDSIYSGIGSNPEARLSVIEKNALDSVNPSLDATLSLLTSTQNTIKSTLLQNNVNKYTREINYEKALEYYETLLLQTAQDERMAELSLEAQKAALEQSKASHSTVIDKPRSVDLEGINAGIKEAQASYQLIKIQRDKAFIRAPIDGVISVVQAKSNILVSPGTPLLSLINEKGLQVSTYINEKDISLIHLGGGVLVEDTIPASITNIAPSIDPETHKIKVIAIIEDVLTKKLLIDQFVRVRFLITEDENEKKSYRVPLSAIKTNLQGSFIFIIDNTEKENNAKAVKIDVTRIIGEYAEIIPKESLFGNNMIIQSVSGISPNERIKIKKHE